MKQRSTTPVSKGIVAKVSLTAAAFAIIIGAPVMIMHTAKADPFDEKIRAIQKEIDGYQSQAKKYGKRADTLQRKLDTLKNEKAQIQARINLNQAKYEKLQNQIKETNKKIDNSRDALGDVIADMSVDGSISPLEMIASSKNIGDYLDKQTYQSSVRDELNGKIDEIKKLKEELEEQKEETKSVLANQRRARDTLASKEAEQAELVSKTRGKESSYKKLSAKAKAEKKQVMEEQNRVIAQRMGGGSGVKFKGGSDGGYPWGGGNCTVDANALSHGGSDGNGGDGWGYGCRQCASYAAWKIGQHTGTIPTDLGNANNFPGNLSNRSQGSVAKKNSVGVIMAGQYGHVVWVESNPDSRGYITVSQYNYNETGAPTGWGHFSRMQVHQSTYDTFIYF